MLLRKPNQVVNIGEERPSRTRNRSRGIRSQIAYARRANLRSIRRLLCRRRKRTPLPPGATAQDPSTLHKKTWWRLKRQLLVGSVNICGLRNGIAELEIERWMKKWQIDVCCIQETKKSGEQKYQTKKYTWFLSGNDSEHGTEHAGVGIVIRHERRNYIDDVRAISNRILVLTLKGKVPIVIISAYAPTAVNYNEIVIKKQRKGRDEHTVKLEKEVLYEALREEVKRKKHNQCTILAGDFNARVQEK